MAPSTRCLRGACRPRCPRAGRPSAAPRPSSGRRGRPRTGAGRGVSGRGSSSTCARPCLGCRDPRCGRWWPRAAGPQPRSGRRPAASNAPDQPGAAEGVEDDDLPAMTTPAVLKLPGGPKRRTEWQSSAANSRPNALGAAEDHPPRLRSTDPQGPELPGSGPGGRPGAGRLARAPGALGLPRPALPQPPGRRLARLTRGRPGGGAAAPAPGDLGGFELQPGMPEGQTGELA
jgi:hypothetical protein